MGTSHLPARSASQQQQNPTSPQLPPLLVTAAGVRIIIKRRLAWFRGLLGDAVAKKTARLSPVVCSGLKSQNVWENNPILAYAFHFPAPGANEWLEEDHRFSLRLNVCDA